MLFKHSQPMPWILPGVPATNQQVEVIVVSIVCVRGGKLYSEHVYWDQASVLLQVGLLDPKLIPEKMKAEGINRLPIVGREAARRILDGSDGKMMNELVPGWSGAVNQKDNGREKGSPKVKKEASEMEDKSGEEELGVDAGDDEAKDVVKAGSSAEEAASGDARKKENESGKQTEESDEGKEEESADEDEKNNKGKTEEEHNGSKTEGPDKRV